MNNTASEQYKFSQRQYWTCFKLLKNIMMWHGFLSDEVLQELVIDGLLNRCGGRGVVGVVSPGVVGVVSTGVVGVVSTGVVGVVSCKCVCFGSNSFFPSGIFCSLYKTHLQHHCQL